MNAYADDALNASVIEESAREGEGSRVIIALWRPRWEINVANAVRAAACFGAQEVVLLSPRYVPATNRKGDRAPRPLRMKAYASVRVHRAEARSDALTPPGYTPVAVELRPEAAPLPKFEHPERAIYVFGPEDGSLETPVLKHCPHTISIPTGHCLNLAAAVNIVLYDRLCKNR